MALALAVNRHLHKAYVKVRENDFSLGGLMGMNFHGKTAGIIGTGKIGSAMARMCHGFGMNIIAYDVFENPSIKDFVTYVTLDELLAQSDLISLHCPLMDNTYHPVSYTHLLAAAYSVRRARFTSFTSFRSATSIPSGS